MAYDSVREQLDKLLGADRNGPLNPATAEPATHFTADSICKHYLLGFCPHDLHIKHRSEPGSCRHKHCDKARAEFQRELAEKGVPQKAAWTRALLAECRAIVQDEDRKIRANARRLQTSYGETGNLSGLMIRSFDTLKKLGMVRQDAQIRILSEMQHSDDEANEEDFYRPSVENSSSPTTQQRTTVPSAATSGQQDKSVNGAPSTPASNEDDSNDLDGFGVIQVIPSKGDQQGKHSKDTSTTSGSDSQGKDASADEDDDLDGFGVIQVIPATNNGAKLTDEENTKAQNLGKSVCESPSSKVKQSAEISVSAAAKPTEKAPLKAAESRERKEMASSDTPHESIEAAANDKATSTDDKMEEFYKSGRGPDGLLMLDRKRGLRVCACCGGYISLVDAESRLLSHYGGKSHHSLAQLRAKVTELEKEVASEPEPASENWSRYRDYQRPNGRDAYWQRRDDRRQRGPDRSDRYGHNQWSEQDGRGHGTAGWYHNSGDRRANDYRSGGRWEDDRQRRGRYEHGRKRFRSPSPQRRNRRSRGYY